MPQKTVCSILFYSVELFNKREEEEEEEEEKEEEEKVEPRFSLFISAYGLSCDVKGKT
jgi:hypothetical protein